MNRIYFVNQTLQLSTLAIENVITLLQEGATVPFIARYRKERSQGMDEVQITTVRDLSKKFDEILQKQQQIIQAATDQGKLNEELKNKVLTNFDLPSLDDLYLPFKQKRETRGAKARKLGLEPLAKIIMSQRSGDPFHLAERFVKGQVLSEEDALQGAQDII